MSRPCYTGRLIVTGLSLAVVLALASPAALMADIPGRPAKSGPVADRPLVRIAADFDGASCCGRGTRLEALVEPGSAAAPFTYMWSGPGLADADQAVAVVADSLAPGTYTYAVRVRGADGAVSEEAVETLTVANGGSCSITGPGVVCPSSVTTYCGPSGADSYSWSVTSHGTIVGSSTSRCVDVRASSGCFREFTLTLRVSGYDRLEASGSDGVTCPNTCSKNVTVVDVTRPVITCPANITIDCGASIDPSNTGAATATDVCTASPTITYSDVVVAGKCPVVRTITRTWRATDACNNSATCVQTITVVDSTKPAFTEKLPADVTVDCDKVPEAEALAVTDICDPSPVVKFSEVREPGDCPNRYKLIRTWTATDRCGNTAEHVQVVQVDDSTPPEMTCPADTSVQCPDDVPEPDVERVTATADCGDTVFVEWVGDISDGNTCPETITRTYRGTDGCGNSATCDQTIVVDDTVPPWFTCTLPRDVTVECNRIPLPYPVTATDNCRIDVPVEFSEVKTPGNCPDSYVLTRTWTATDDCGNSIQHVQVLTVVDTTRPEFVEALPKDVTVECDDVPEPETLTATDNCDDDVEVTFDEVKTAGRCADSYTLTRTWTATDDCGNSAQHVQVVTVVDTTRPVFVGDLPKDVTVECDDVPDAPTLTATDNCDADVEVTLDEVKTAGRCADSYTLTRTWTATDDCGNSVQHVQVVTVVDTTAPRISCPAEIRVQCQGDVPEPSPGSVNASDNCDADVEVTWDGDVSDGLTCPETVTRTYRATDNCNNSATCTQAIIILDTIPPRIVCPGDRRFECDDTVNFGEPDYSDNCDQSLSLTFQDQTIPGANPYEYQIRRTWTVTDDCLNSASCTQTVTVSDQTPPEITCPADARFECDETVEFGQATAEDNCDSEPEITWRDQTIPGKCPGEYQIQRTWIATDASDNSMSCHQTVTVYDGTAPVLVCPADVTYECDNVGDPGTATATDNCDENPEVTHSDVILPGECEQEYTIVRTWAAEDDCGRIGTCEQRIRIVDTTPPEITCPPDAHFEVGQNIDFGLPIVVDRCDDEVEVTHSDRRIDGQCPQAYTIVRTWTATDDCENSASCEQTVTVGDETPPVITCPGDRTFQCDQTVVFGQATAVDTGDPSPLITFVDRTIPGSCPQAYVIERTWTATDACGNAASCVQVVRVVDSIAPVITCPSNRTFQCTQPVEFGTATATDNCDKDVAITYSDVVVPGNSPQQYSIQRTWRAVDDCGNASTCRQTVNVVDTRAPVLVGPPDGRLFCDQPVVFTDPVATDSCDRAPVIVVVSNTATPGPGDCEVSYTRCWEARDASGNVSNRVCQTIIRYEDYEPPVLTCAPDKEIQRGDPVIFDEPIYSDNCPVGGIQPEALQSALTTEVVLQETTYTRCWVAFDQCGNQSNECCQTITVADPPEPPPYCTFVCWNWTAACLKDPYNHEISTPPACLRDEHFYDVFPSGVTIGTHAAPGLFVAKWTSPGAVERFKCAYGLPEPLKQDWVDPRQSDLGALQAELLTLRLNREFSCAGYFEAYGYPMGQGCFGEFVLPPETIRFAGITVDQFLAVGDRAVAGDKSALLPYGYSYFRLHSTAAYLNWLFGECNGFGMRSEQAPSLLTGADGDAGWNVADDDASGLPEKFSMTGQPNPMRGNVTITLALPAEADVSLDIYDVQGRVVTTLVREHKQAGYYSVTWDGTDGLGGRAASGIYFCRVQIDGQLAAMAKLMKL